MEEETDFENGRISNSEGLVTLILDRVTWHTVVQHSLTSVVSTNKSTYGRQAGCIRSTQSRSRQSKVLLETQGPSAIADLRLVSPLPYTSLHCETMVSASGTHGGWPGWVGLGGLVEYQHAIPV